MARPKGTIKNIAGATLAGMEEHIQPKVTETPLMRQYNGLKQQYPGAIILFRVGDFYETFGEDAILASKILNITLTRRANGAASEIELAGFPHHAIDAYLPRLVRAGQRVAICDQLEDPKLAKGIVKRGVTEIISPGTVLSETLLNGKRNNYLAAIYFSPESEPDQVIGMAFCDVSTGDFFCLHGNTEKLEKLLYALRPSEVILSRKDLRLFKTKFGEDFYIYRQEDWVFESNFARTELLRHFQTPTLKGFGLEDEPTGTLAAGVLLYYLKQNEQHKLGHISRLYALADENYVSLDKITVRNLELFASLHPDGKSFSEAIDQTITPMGARLLNRWIAFPLRDIHQIQQRQNAVEALLHNTELQALLTNQLQKINDLERLCTKLAVGRINPRELAALGATLSIIPILVDSLQKNVNTPFGYLLNTLQPIHEPKQIILNAIDAAPPPNLNSGGVIKAGYSKELDHLRNIKSEAEGFLKNLQITEAQRTGITSLKISYNRVFGYYIEITHAHKDKVPTDYIRKQTLTGAERYITPQLKEFEENILSADEKRLRIETELYESVIASLQPYLSAFQSCAQFIAQVDVLLSFCLQANRWHYCKPTLTNEIGITIDEGRHPVIEMLLPRDQPYIPNSVQLPPKGMRWL